MKEWCRQNIDFIVNAILIFIAFLLGLMGGAGFAYEDIAKSAVNVDITQQNNITHGTVTYPNSANVRIESKNGQTIIVVK